MKTENKKKKVKRDKNIINQINMKIKLFAEDATGNLYYELDEEIIPETWNVFVDVETMFQEFYKNNETPEGNNFKTSVPFDEESIQFLIEEWKKFVAQNRELLYPES